VSTPSLRRLRQSPHAERAIAISSLSHTGILVGDEVKFVWTRQRSLFSLFWFLVRYLRDGVAVGAHVDPLLSCDTRSYFPTFSSLSPSPPTAGLQRCAQVRSCIMASLTVSGVVRHPCTQASTFNDQFCSCVRWTQVKVFLVWLSIFSGRLCWCLRTYALWNRPRWLIVIGVPAIILEVVIILAGSMQIRYIPIPSGIRQACLASPGAGFWSIMAWIVPFIFDTTMSLLSIVRAMRVSRSLKTPLTTQLIRDGSES